VGAGGDVLELDRPLGLLAEGVRTPGAHLFQPVAKARAGGLEEGLRGLLREVFPPELEEEQPGAEVAEELGHPGELGLGGLGARVLVEAEGGVGPDPGGEVGEGLVVLEEGEEGFGIPGA